MAISFQPIDGAYPVAGQDNNSQGFRDNFTNTSTNFQFAADEITDLQNNAILKSALTGTTLNNNMQGSLLYNAQFQQISETRVLQTLTTGSITINFALGSYQIINSSTGSISLALTNFPAAGTTGSVAVQVTISNRSHTLTIPNTVSTNNRGIQGLNTSTNVITFAAPGTYSFVFTTSDGGSSYTITDTNKQLQPFNNSSENLTSGSAANLALTTSYFSTVTSSTATLAAGVEGQIKTFVMYEESGNMVITVTNAGWGGAGTITFNATGEACTLQYINAKWFCIGNNGATFA
jgi:hypothetical protein